MFWQKTRQNNIFISFRHHLNLQNAKAEGYFLLQKLHKNIGGYHAIILGMDGTLYYQTPLHLYMAFALLRYYMLHLNRLHELLRLHDFRKSNECGQLIAADKVTAYWMHEAPLKYVYQFRDKK
jgi:hypothetical protein